MCASEISTVKTIAQINDETRNFILVGVVIAKSDPRYFSGHPKGRGPFEADSTTADTSHETARGVLTLTLRDSNRDTINCTVWGKADTIIHYDGAFAIGDVIDVNRPQVAASMFGRSEQYSPTVTSPYCLTVNDQTVQGAQITRHDGPAQELQRFRALLRVPLVQPGETIPLADIVASGSGCNGETFNVLVVVRAVRAKRDVRVARSNQVKTFREVILMDGSHGGVLMKLWSDSYIRWSEQWVPLKTTLLIVDARAEFNAYYKTICLAVDRKTIITQEPAVPQLASLLNHARSIPTQEIDVVCSLASGSVDPSTINTVMTVQQILDRTEGDLVQEEDQFTALCYAVITRFDLDGCSRLVSERCAHCRSLVREPKGTCGKYDCPGQTTAPDAREPFFDIAVDVTDHTGTLTGCRMASRVAETVLCCDVATFLRQTDTQRTVLKWKYLLDRCAVRLIVKRRSAVRFQHLYSIVDCAIADPAEVEAKLKVY
ncbi:meiosis-specific with OB domain-containing protein [Anopheles arabiensis]|uniref:MEIOB-like N-terminal domain-containing protein n=1 Tax=Anopheles arabiensis TaxID=7173 RepID=A0A182HNC1_ANOAR|nr:meiosis-specific with OB domain-containing protein [Anopheles arabiensis]